MYRYGVTDEVALGIKVKRFSKGGKGKVRMIVEPEVMTGVGCEDNGPSFRNVFAEVRRHELLVGTSKPSYVG